MTTKKSSKKAEASRKAAAAKRKVMTMKALGLMGKMQADEEFNEKLRTVLEDERSKDPKAFERAAQMISSMLEIMFDEYDADADLRAWVQTSLRAHAEVKS